MTKIVGGVVHQILMPAMFRWLGTGQYHERSIL